MVLSFALYASLVALGNITDYNANFFLVTHVLAMDTTFPDNRSMWRAIESPFIHHAVYGMIICAEIAIAACCWIGGLRLYKNIDDPLAFNQAKRIPILGLMLGFLLWFTGFMTIGGEWFLMWQSDVANAQQAAFRLVIIIAIVLIFLVQPDEDSHV
jgi:predicted small integral membrane protein